jgi:hypothetical protein
MKICLTNGRYERKNLCFDLLVAAEEEKLNSGSNLR